MSKKKYYAVRVGKVPGIYETWPECQEQTLGFSGAVYKSFSSKEDAEGFIIGDFDETTGEVIEDVPLVIDYDKSITNDLNDGYLVAFTDGSHDPKTETASYGVYILTPNFEKSPSRIEEISSKINTPKFKESRNIVGEVYGVINALDWALKNDYSKVSIYCDYQGLLEWANGSWNANSDIAKFYVEKIAEYMVMIELKFIWVKGHSNVQGNEQADILAKNALRGSRQILKTGVNFFSGSITNENKLEELKAKVIDNISTTEVPITRELTETTLGVKETLKWKKEKLHVTYYNSNRTFLVQGAPGYLFSMLLSIYSESLEAFNMVRMFSNAYESTIIATDVDSEFNHLNLPSDYPESFKILIKQSISSLKVKNKNEYDYGHYTVPAYRALEGHMRYLSEKAGYHVDRNFNLGGSFNKDKNTGVYSLDNGILKNHSNSIKIEECYNLYYNRRHPLLHTGEIGIVDETELIPTLEEAQDRIKEVLSVIKY